MPISSPRRLWAPALIILASLISNAACTSHECNAMYVPSGAALSRPVTASFDASKPLHVELCYNDICRSGDFSIGAGSSAESQLCATDTPILSRDGCSFLRESDGSWSFDAFWDVTRAAPTNGDRYRANLTSSDGVVLVSVDVKATYTESEPNGGGCGTTKRATL